MKYEYLDEGKIIVVNNFRFEDGSLDHSWNKGRLCLILFIDNEYEYVLPIKSDVKEINFPDKYYIDKSSFEFFYDRGYNETTLNDFIGYSKNYRIKSKINKDLSGYVSLEHVFKIPIAYRNEIGKLDYDTYKSIIEKLHKIQKTTNDEELKERAFNVR